MSDPRDGEPTTADEASASPSPSPPSPPPGTPGAPEPPLAATPGDAAGDVTAASGPAGEAPPTSEGLTQASEPPVPPTETAESALPYSGAPESAVPDASVPYSAAPDGAAPYAAAPDGAAPHAGAPHDTAAEDTGDDDTGDGAAVAPGPAAPEAAPTDWASPADATRAGTGEPAAPAAAEEPVPLAIPGEQIEWQPVVTGDQIEWQPVVVSDPDAAWVDDAASQAPVSDPYAYGAAGPDAGAYDSGEVPPAGWDPTAVPVGGNGTDGARAAAPVSARSRTQPPPAAPPTPTAAGPGGTTSPPPAKAKRQVIILSALTAAVVVIAVLGFVLSRGASKKGGQASAPTTTSVSVVTVPAADLVTFHDKDTGFTVKYPKTWKPLGAPVSDIRLTLDAGNNDGMQVRIFPIQTPATTDNIANLKAVTDTIVFGNPESGFQEIQEQLVTLNGKLTYYYIYTFPDPVSGQQGVHVTYFVFEGHRMFEMVFQAVPADDFRQEAGIFDQVAESFTVDPESSLPTTTAPAPAPTTAPPTSTP